MLANRNRKKLPGLRDVEVFIGATDVCPSVRHWNFIDTTHHLYWPLPLMLPSKQKHYFKKCQLYFFFNHLNSFRGIYNVADITEKVLENEVKSSK